MFTRDAKSRRELSSLLRAEGLAVLGVEELPEHSGSLPPAWHPSWLLPAGGFDVESGFRQLASMLRGGVPLLKALETVQEQAASPRARRAWMRVSDRVLGGGSFAAALGEQPSLFGEVAVRLSEVGEKSGELERTLSRAADQMESRRSLRTAVVNALAYPLAAVAMAVGVSAYLVGAVIPKVADFLQSGGVALPPVTQLLVDVSTWVAANAAAVAAVPAVAAAAWAALRISGAGRELEDAFLLRVPVTGRILRLSGTALFARSMQIMTESGVPLLDALAAGSRLMPNWRLRRRVAEAHDGVLSGRGLAESFAGAVEFMPMLRRMAAVGEVGGSLPEAFGETARFHEAALALAVRRFGMLIEPVTIAVTGVIVGFVYIAFFTALFAVAETG